MGEVDEDGGDAVEVEEGILDGLAMRVRLGIGERRIEKVEYHVGTLLVEELGVESEERASKVVVFHERMDDGLECGAESGRDEKAAGLLELQVALVSCVVGRFCRGGEGEGGDINV